MEKTHSSGFHNGSSKTQISPLTASKHFIVLHETRYFLNSSKSKYVSVGIYFNNNYFTPCVCIGGLKFKNFILLDDGDWTKLLSFKQHISNSMLQSESSKAINLNSCIINFENFKDIRVLKLEDNFANSVYLGDESLTGLWALSDIIQYRLDMLKDLNFDYYFKNILSTTSHFGYDDLVDNIYRKIQPGTSPKNENICIALEFINLPQTLLEGLVQRPYGYYC